MQTFVTRGSHKQLWAEIGATQIPESYDYNSYCKIYFRERQIAQIDLDWPSTMELRGHFDYRDNAEDPEGMPDDFALTLNVKDLKLLTQILKDCIADDGFENNFKLWLDCEKEQWVEPANSNNKAITEEKPE